jgi:hypothetical protein
MSKIDNEMMSANPRDHRRARHLRQMAGLLFGLTIAGVSVACVAAPLMSPGPLMPFARLVQLGGSQASRVAYVQAQVADGYMLLQPMSLAQIDL